MLCEINRKIYQKKVIMSIPSETVEYLFQKRDTKVDHFEVKNQLFHEDYHFNNSMYSLISIYYPSSPFLRKE